MPRDYMPRFALGSGAQHASSGDCRQIRTHGSYAIQASPQTAALNRLESEIWIGGQPRVISYALSLERWCTGDIR